MCIFTSYHSYHAVFLVHLLIQFHVFTLLDHLKLLAFHALVVWYLGLGRHIKFYHRNYILLLTVNGFVYAGTVECTPCAAGKYAVIQGDCPNSEQSADLALLIYPVRRCESGDVVL